MPTTTTRRLTTVPATALLTLVTALGLVTVSAPSAQAGAAERRERRVDAAMAVTRDQKGDPYGYGAEGPRRFDCSGLIYYAFGRAGFDVPRTSEAQARSLGRRIAKRDVRRGDLVFFYDGGGVYHAGVFAGRAHGHAYLVHASKPGTDVARDRIWTSRWFGRTLR